MTKEQQRAALAAMMEGKPVTKIATAPMDAALSASRLVATEAKTKVEKKLEAQAYAEPKKRKRVKRNWEAQARYDEQHGTSNGYDERIEQAILDRNYEAGDY